eukprot:1136241-Pelagomonas_calceolata.AAC.3
MIPQLLQCTDLGTGCMVYIAQACRGHAQYAGNRMHIGHCTSKQAGHVNVRTATDTLTKVMVVFKMLMCFYNLTWNTWMLY